MTRRTSFRKAFLAPWDPRVEQCWLYALADAQRLTNVAVHHGVRVVSHQHVSVTLAEENLGRFLRRFHARRAARSTRSSRGRGTLAGRPAVFPHGTYGMRVFHGVKVAGPNASALVAQPGPLLHEVLDELRGGARGRVNTDARVRVLDEVRAAWVEEAGEVIAADELDFAGAAAPPPRTSAGTTPEATDDPVTKDRARREPDVRHRFDRDGEDGTELPRRVIIHRDRRRGRPPKKPRGSDPPS